MSYLKHKPGSIEELMANQNQKLNDNAYQDMFKKELEKAGRGIGAMSPKEKKDFFNKIDDKYKAKNEEVSKVVPAGSHKMPDGTIMKDKDHKKEVKEEDAYDKDDEKPKSKPKKETHSFMTKDMNKSKKDAKGEKEIVDPKPKISFKEAYKKVKENQSTIDDSTQDRANQGVSGEDDKKKDPDIKKPKGKADTGSKATPVDTSPEVEYKN